MEVSSTTRCGDSLNAFFFLDRKKSGYNQERYIPEPVGVSQTWQWLLRAVYFLHTYSDPLANGEWLNPNATMLESICDGTWHLLSLEFSHGLMRTYMDGTLLASYMFQRYGTAPILPTQTLYFGLASRQGGYSYGNGRSNSYVRNIQYTDLGAGERGVSVVCMC